jgi:hypothetical protein
MLANYLQHQRRSKMDLGLVFIFIIVGVSIFVGISLAAIFFLLEENNRIGEELEKNSPPF